MNGSAKAWCHLDLKTENTIDDSLNVSSISDVATGQVAVTASSAMATINYTSAGSAWNGVSPNYARVISPYDARTTTVIYISTFLTSNNAQEDCQDVDIVNHGDLA